MIHALEKAFNLLSSSFDQTALISGTSDIIVTRWSNGEYHSTPFIVCFGNGASHKWGQNVEVFVNGFLIENLDFHIGKHGYLHPMKPPQEIFQRLNLGKGKNSIKFVLGGNNILETEIHLYEENDKILVSDVDGTMTKSDLSGIINNLFGESYLHEGYSELLQEAERRGVKIVWLTMRSLALYDFSKKYIVKQTQVCGALLTEPEEFLSAFKKEVMRETGNVKVNMMKRIRETFPKNVNPFIGGLGNRENDAIAYRAASIPFENIYIVDPKSQVHRLSSKEALTYTRLSRSLEIYFQSCSIFEKSIKKNTSLSTEDSDEFLNEQPQLNI